MATENRSMKAGAELDPWYYTHKDVNGDDTDFSSGYTFSLTAATAKDAVAEFTKTSNITGLATGIRVDWATTGELNDLDPGVWWIQLRARNGSSKDLDLADVRLIITATNH
jgi:hypothetical protein